MEKKWYVAQVLSGHEKKVKRNLEELLATKGMSDVIEEVLLPIENVSEVKKGEQKIVEKKVWPGYLLLKMELTDDSWLFVKNAQGVIDLLGGEKPTALSDREVDEILADLQKKRDHITQKHQFKPGDRVKIVDGVFVNFIGSVLEVYDEKGRLSVMVSIFGRDTRVDDLEFLQVELLDDDAEVS